MKGGVIVSNIVELKNITKTFYQKYHDIHVLKDINLQIEKGEFVAITGTSGCGKTTLLNLIGMQMEADSGEFYMNEINVMTLKEKEKLLFRQNMIAMIFQFFNLIDILTLKENILLPLQFMKKKVNEDKLNAYVKQLGLEEHMNHFPSECSGGQQQRVALIRALMCETPIILADEPTGNLDEKTSYEVMQLLKEINQEHYITIVMVTHDNELAQMADRILWMHDGRLEERKKE